MKKYFYLLASTMMLCACGGNKTQNNASDETAGVTESVAGDEVVTDDNGQELLWGYVSIDNDALEAVENVDREEFALAQEFLMGVVYPSEEVDTYSEEWITAHCSPEVKAFLREQYDFDGEGYAMWLMEGRVAGEGEYDTEVTGFGYGVRHGKPMYAVEKRFSFEGMESFVRTLYYGLERKGEDFVITQFEMNLESKDPTVSAIEGL